MVTVRQLPVRQVFRCAPLWMSAAWGVRPVRARLELLSGRPVVRPRWRGRREVGLRASEAAIVADLLAACLSAGCTPAHAAHAVAEALGGAAAGLLDDVAARLNAGDDPALAWAGVEAVPALAAIGRAMVRSAQTGIAVAGVVAAEAARVRARRRDESTAALARLGTFAAVPLALCFLPAFVCLGVVPVVVGLAAAVLDGGLWTEF